MNLRTLSTVALGAVCLLAALPGRGQFADNFDSNSSANWRIFEGSGNGVPDYTADFSFNYGTNRYVANGVTNLIPSAPNSTGGTTRGLKLTVNNNDEVAATAGVSLYPLGQTFGGNYVLKFDLWMNYNGGAYGGSGSTEFATFGINHAGDKVNWSGAPVGDGVWFAVAGEAGSGAASGDYRSYTGDNSSPPIALIGSGGFLDRDNDGVFENEVAPETPPRHPLKLIFSNPPFETSGAPGKRWVQVEIRQRDGLFTWLIDGYVIAEHPNTASGNSGNIMIGYMDSFSSIANPREDNFALFDNVRVEPLTTMLPVVTIAATDPTAAEPGTDTGTVRFSRSGDSSGPLTVHFRIGGTASNGVDYAAVTNRILIPAGQSFVDLIIQPIDDNIGEPAETVFITLAGSSEYDIRESLFAEVTILDDGDIPAASLVTTRPHAYELVSSNAGIFTIVLAGSSTTNLTVRYTLSGTATNGVDYSTVPSSVVIPAGQTNAVIRIAPIDNNRLDTNRTVILTLQSSGSYRLGNVTNGTVTIRNDDLPPGVNLFVENFDTAASSNRWRVNAAQADDIATFGYDYSLDGIPLAPHTADGTTRGLKLEANVSLALFSGLSVSPIGQGFTGDYRLRFDMWMNYNGPLFDGGSQSTELFTAGIGTSGDVPVWPGAPSVPGVYFAVTGDGGSASDYRAYTNSGAPLPVSSGVYDAGSLNNTSPYYAAFGGDPAPELQRRNFPSDQTGTTGLGNGGFAWHDVVITKRGNRVNWSIDAISIATVDITGLNLSTNIFVGYFDSTAGSAPIPALIFGLVDNLRVESLGVEAPRILRIEVVSPTSRAITFTAAGASASDFTVEGAATVNGPYQADPGASVTMTSPGQFRAVVSGSGEMRFYRIRR